MTRTTFPFQAQSQWAAPAARQLPELRGEVLTWLDQKGRDFYAKMMMAGLQRMGFDDDPPAAAARLARAERNRVRGHLYWVSNPMTTLARTAGAQLSEQVFYPHELPSRTGFMVFEDPLGSWVN